MSLNSTPSAERIHIGIFGRRNAGKSSIANAVTGQNLAIVSDIKGTTTDPVQKTMELLPLGPVVIIDTPGLDDIGELGELRIRKAYQMLNKTDIAVLVVDASVGMTLEDISILKRIQEKKIPCVIAKNKSDLCKESDPVAALGVQTNCPEEFSRIPSISVSAETGENIYELKELIASLVPKEEKACPLLGDLISPGDFIVLVVPIDSAAPKGRLILPQQQTIREILDLGATAVVVKDTELEETLVSIGKRPSLVITDSQAFQRVNALVPKEIPLTSFSILFARRKGDLKTVVKGAHYLDHLKDNDRVLISEGCTHHRQCDDIGTVKLPRWIKEYTGRDLQFEFSSGTGFPEDLSGYSLIIHCGGCMLNEKEVRFRMKCAEDADVPFTNYGTAIAYIHGILDRSTEIFTE